jgi:HlyD family secretion protein
MKRWMLLIAGGLAIATAGTLYGTGNLKAVEHYTAHLFKKPQQPRQERVLPAITVVRAEQRDFAETLLVTGSLVAREQVLVAPEISGQRILQVLVEEGDTVKKGEILARLVATNLDAQVAQNKAATERATAAIAQAESAIEQAKANLVQAESALKRATSLKSSGNLSQATYDQRLATTQSARAQYASALDGLKVAKAELAQLKAQRLELDWRRRNTLVRAPADGIISRRNARIGALASATAEPMFQIIRNGEIELDGEATADQLARMQLGQTATVSVTGVADLSGKVRLISPEVDRTTRLGRVRIALPHRSDLRIGTFARARILTATGRGLSVPLSAVMYDGNIRFVLTVDSGTVKRREIETGLEQDGHVEVRRGLAPGIVVIAKAGTFLRDGDRVRTMPLRSARFSEVD